MAGAEGQSELLSQMVGQVEYMCTMKEHLDEDGWQDFLKSNKVNMFSQIAHKIEVAYLVPCLGLFLLQGLNPELMPNSCFYIFIYMYIYIHIFLFGPEVHCV